MLHITFSKYDCIIVHKAYYLFTCTCVSINSFHSHSHSHINGEDIENVEHFLGIILDEKLSWINHINMLSNKISKVIGVMYKLKNVLPEYILLILYNALSSSHLNYGLTV